MSNLRFVALWLVFLVGCAHLTGGSVQDERTARGLRYYLPRPQFVVEHQTTGDSIQSKVSIMRVPDLRFPQQVYMTQGWFSADVFDVQINDLGLLKGVSAETTDKSVESVKSVGSFAVGLAASAAGLPTIPKAAGTSSLTAQSPDRQPLIVLASFKRGSASSPSCDASAQDKLRTLSNNLVTLTTAISKARQDLTAARKALAEKKHDVAHHVVVGARVAAREVLDQASDCMRQIAKGASQLSADIAQTLENDDVKSATSVLQAQLDAELNESILAAAAAKLETDLLDGFFSLTSSDLVQELRQRSDRASDPETKNGLADAAGDFETLLRPEGMDTIQVPIKQAVPTCGGKATKQDVTNLQTVFRLLEADVGCLIQKQTTEDVAADRQFLNHAPEALAALHGTIELLLDPAAGGVYAIRERARDLIDLRDQDKRFADETLLHRSLRVRDRLREFTWRRAEFLATAKYSDSRSAAVYEAKGKLARIGRLLAERVAVRTATAKLLGGAVTTATGDVITSLRAQESAISAEIETLRTIRSIPLAGVPRTITPQIYWVTQTADLPKQGDQLGNPGDVLIIVRPVAAGGGQ